MVSLLLLAVCTYLPVSAAAHLCPPMLPPRRLVALLQWLLSRPERHLAVVSHSSFIFFMMSAFGHTAAPTVQTELHKWCVTNQGPCLPHARPACFAAHWPTRCLTFPCAAKAIGSSPRCLPATARSAAARRYDNCEMRTVVLADEGGAHSHHDPLHFHGGPGVDPDWTPTPTRP